MGTILNGYKRKGQAKGMKKRSAWGRFASLLVIVVICNMTTACGIIVRDIMDNSHESLAGTRKDAAYSGPAFQKIIVIGLTNNSSTRISFENAFMDQLVGHGVNTVIGTIDLPGIDSLRDRSLVEKVLQNGNFDGVITVEVKDAADKDTLQWQKAWVATPIPGPDNMFEILSKADKSTPVPPGMMRYEISLWDVKTARQVWAGATSAGDRYDMLPGAYAAAHSTVETLLKAKLLRSTM